MLIACSDEGGGEPLDGGAQDTLMDGGVDAATADDAGAHSAPMDGSDGAAPDGPTDARPPDALDAAAPVQEGCTAEVELGSATGIDVATGTTVGEDDTLFAECFLGTREAPDVVFHWRAPSAGRWVFDTVGSDFDTVLHVRDLGCRLRACSDDISVVTELSRAALDADEGEEFFVVVEGAGAPAGAFKLSISQSPDREGDCGDGFDDDRDGLTDCADFPECADAPACSETDCSNGADDDGDGYTDCFDHDCNDSEPCVEVLCGDGLDGDGDFLTDCSDSDCDAREPCAEVLCDDGLDGDMNGLADCDDPACSCALHCFPDSCPDRDLGSRTGLSVATGVTEGCPRRTPDASRCAGDVNGGAGAGPEKTFLWTAPADGTYTFDLAGSGYDTTLYLSDGCDGPMLACNEDIVAGVLQNARLTMDFEAGRSIIIVVDGYGEESGAFLLSIFQSP